MNEKEYQAQIVELAKTLGFLVYHPFDSRRSTAGFPDLVLIRSPRVLFVEVKSETGKLSLDQQVWLGSLSACPGVEAYVTRPSGWEEMAKVLAGEEGPCG